MTATNTSAPLPFSIVHRAKLVKRFGPEHEKRIDRILAENKDVLRPVGVHGRRRIYNSNIVPVVGRLLKQMQQRRRVPAAAS